MNRNRERDRDRHSKKKSGNWKNSRRETGSFSAKKQFRPPHSVTLEQIRAEEEAIQLFKSTNRPVCAHCGQPIVDMSSALIDAKEGKPIHFDCALEILSDSEKLGDNEKIIYIGKGRFGILYFPNIHDARHFEIRKIIEWEDAKIERASWRTTMSELYSRIK